jgi:hypothetical protein
MGQLSLAIIQVNTVDDRGGASQVAWNFHNNYIRRGLHAYMAVGQKHCRLPTVSEIPNLVAKSYWTRSLSELAKSLMKLNFGSHKTEMLRKIIHFVAEPCRQIEILRGIEDFQNPGTWRLLELFPEAADIIHCHNLHGGYFDLRFLPWVSRQVPVILTLHDAWLLSGHCAHSFDCERW